MSRKLGIGVNGMCQALKYEAASEGAVGIFDAKIMHVV